MANDTQYLPALVGEMLEHFGVELRLAVVEELEAEAAIFVQDGNHGEYRPLQYEFVNDGVPFVRPPNLIDGRVDLVNCDRINDTAFRRVRKGIGQGGDIILTSNATVGRVAITRPTDPVFVANPQTTVWRSTNPSILNQRYLYYFMTSSGFQQQLATHTGQKATFDYVSLTKQRSLVIPLPPLAEQRAIANILGVLDDKIELNRRMNETLEGLARAIFQSWFVDFDPVRAQRDGLPPPALSPTTAALFPDSFEDSQLGKIPKGWRYVAVRDVIEGLYDGPHATPAKSDHGAVFLGIDNLTGTRIELSQIRYIAEEDWPKWTRRVLPQHGDIVLTYEATLGYFAIIPANLRCCLGRRLALVRAIPTANNYHFLFHTFVASPFQQHLHSHAVHGATVNRVPLLDFPKYPILMPPPELVDRFEAVAKSTWDRIHRNQEEQRTLAAIRDALLPKLLSGEIRVAAAERLVEDAT